MSKFRARIRDIGRAPGGMGFAAIARQERPRHVIVVAEAASADEARSAAEAGADAVVVVGSMPGDLDLGIPVGVRIEEATKAEVQAACDAGADFFVFDDGRTHADALTVGDEFGAVLILGADQDEQRLRSVSAIDLDAVLVEAEADTITVREQIELRRVAAFTGAPLLLRSQGRPTAAQLEAWRDAGAPAVLVAAADTSAAVEAAGEVPAPRRNRGEQRLPVLGGPAQAEEHEHDHEDE